MSALLAVLAGTARLSRRDRAALTLALELCRCRGDIGALVHGDTVAREILDASAWCWRHGHESWRSRRARLALLLRLVLRCDAGEPPPAWRVLAGWRLMSADAAERYGGGSQTATRGLAELIALLPRWHDVDVRIERIVPLWEQAPATRAR